MKLAFIDLDHTVMINPFWPAVFPHFARHVAAHAPAQPSQQQVIDGLMARSRALSVRQDVGANDWDRLTQECAAGFGVEWAEPIAGLVERYRDTASAVEGAHAMLAELRDAGWTCVAASAGFRRYQLPPLRHLGLLDRFDQLVFADDVGSLKRRRAFYGAIPQEVTHVVSVGDTYVDDCLYPTWFGFAAVWFAGARRAGEVDCGVEPHAQVGRLQQVPAVLSAVARSDALRYRAPVGSVCPVCGGPGDGVPCRLCRCTEEEAERAAAHAGS